MAIKPNELGRRDVTAIVDAAEKEIDARLSDGRFVSVFSEVPEGKGKISHISVYSDLDAELYKAEWDEVLVREQLVARYRDGGWNVIEARIDYHGNRVYYVSLKLKANS